MVLDQFTLLTAVGFSSAALCVAIVGTWLGTRRDRYLLTWSLGLVFIVAGIILFATGRVYDPFLQGSSFVALTLGFALIYAGGMQFCLGRAGWRSVALLVAVAAATIALFFGVGLSGVGTAAGNFAIALLMTLTALQYWRGRAEFPFAMTANAAVYAVTALSFVLCAVVPMIDGQFVLMGRPTNWAEDLNSIVAIFGLTGIGALSLALNQCRVSRVHELASRTDALTGLLNRRALFEEYARHAGASAAVLLFDLDHFKAINDRHGHVAGDHVLRGFAEILRSRLGPLDLAARLGGEEFCVVLRDAARGDALRIGELVRLDLAALRTVAGSEVVAATVSGGLALAEDRARPLDDLIEEADIGLYRAKSTGRNRICGRAVRLVA